MSQAKKLIFTTVENKPAKTSFTANTNQSNESITPARVAGTEIARVTGEKNDFYHCGKLNFTTVENKPAKTSFTANANQSNESITPACVAGTEIARVTGKKIDFYHRGKLNFCHRGN